MYACLYGQGYSSDDINKFLWPVRIGSGVYPNDMPNEKDFLSSNVSTHKHTRVIHIFWLVSAAPHCSQLTPRSFSLPGSAHFCVCSPWSVAG